MIHQMDLEHGEFIVDKLQLNGYTLTVVLLGLLVVLLTAPICTGIKSDLLVMAETGIWVDRMELQTGLAAVL